MICWGVEKTIVDHVEFDAERQQLVNRLQRLLVELVPGHAKKDLTALQAKAILATGRTRD